MAHQTQLQVRCCGSYVVASTRGNRGHTDDVQDISWAPDASAFATASIDNNCIVWDAASKNPIIRFDNHKHYVQVVDILLCISTTLRCPAGDCLGPIRAVHCEPVGRSLVPRVWPQATRCHKEGRQGAQQCRHLRRGCQGPVLPARAHQAHHQRNRYVGGDDGGILIHGASASCCR